MMYLPAQKSIKEDDLQLVVSDCHSLFFFTVVHNDSYSEKQASQTPTGKRHISGKKYFWIWSLYLLYTPKTSA